MVWAGPHKVTAGTFELLSRKVKKLHDPLGSNLHAAWERLSVLLQQIKIPPQFANSNTINPLLLDIQQRLPHHLQCQWCWTHPRNRLLGSGGWDVQDHYEQDVVRWHLPSWKTLQSSWLLAELPSKRKEVERNINIAINLFLSIGWLSLGKERDVLYFEIRPLDDLAVALPSTSKCTYFFCR